MKNKFLILGCQRSGTTLLRLVLDSHPEINCLDEQKSYTQLEKESFEEITASNIGFKVPIYTELMVEYNFIKRFKDYKIIFMDREIHEVCASMLCMSNFLYYEYETIGKWLDDSNRKLAKNYFFKDYLKSINREKMTRMQKIDLACRYWSYKTDSYAKMLKLGFNVKRVKYSDLVSEPEPTIMEILNFLGIPWHDACMKHHKCEHGELDNGIAIGNTNAKRAIDSLSLEKYKYVLTVAEIESIKIYMKEKHSERPYHV